MLTRIVLALALTGASVTASAAADRNSAPTRNTATAQAQVRGHPKAWNAQQSYNAVPSDLQSLYQLGARIRRDTFTHD